MTTKRLAQKLGKTRREGQFDASLEARYETNTSGSSERGSASYIGQEFEDGYEPDSPCESDPEGSSSSDDGYETCESGSVWSAPEKGRYSKSKPEKSLDSQWRRFFDAELQGLNVTTIDWARVREDVFKDQQAQYRLLARKSIKYKDIHRQILCQLSLQMSPALWSRLPQELVDNIVERNLPSSMDRNPHQERKLAISVVSLVCKRCAARYRPLLFHRVTLGRPSDMYYLRAMLTSATSGWLRAHIHWVNLCQPDASLGHELLRSFSVLAAQLPHLLDVSYSCDSLDSWTWLPATLRTSLGGTRSRLKSIQLQKCHFHSASALLRMLGALPVLETVLLEDVSWTASGNPDTLVQCKAGFASIRNLDSHKCQEHWPLAWTFAAASIGHQLGFRGRDESAAVPNDVAAIVGLLKLLAPTAAQRMLFNKQDAAEKDIFSFRCKFQTSMSFEEDAFMELAFVAHARSSYVPADTLTTRVLQRVVLCPSSDFSYNAIKALPWEQIDDVLGACHHLSSVDVLCGADMSADEAAVLAADLERRMPQTTVRVQHTSLSGDPSMLEPVLFNLSSYWMF